MFKLLGYSNADIRKSILSLSDLDLLNCINVFLYIYPAISANFFIYNETSYLITISSSASINKIQIEPRHFYGGNPERLTKEKIDKCIDKAFDYVRKQKDITQPWEILPLTAVRRYTLQDSCQSLLQNPFGVRRW